MTVSVAGGAQEFATAAMYGAALIVIVVNNGMFGTIRMHQVTPTDTLHHHSEPG